MAKIDEKFIVNLQGKEFVTYEGLLDLAHQKGLKGIETELIQAPSKENNNTCIVKAIAKLESGEFHGIGDANTSNVGAFVSKHIIRMAETRAKARALRDLTNVGMTAIEELESDTEDKPSGKYGSNKKTNTKAVDNPKTKPKTNNSTKYVCGDCNAEINQAVNEYSTKNLGRPLCFNCQQKYKKG